jgi:hypothetical protein
VEDQWHATQSFLIRQRQGLPAVDPLPYSQSAFDEVLKKSGLKLDDKGFQIPNPLSKNAPKR